jgi:uncharacterized protein (DUF3084 family)
MILDTSVVITTNMLALLIAVFLAGPAVCALVTLETHRSATRASRRNMKRREKELSNRAVWVLEREQNAADRDIALDAKEARVALRETELGRAAHDMSTQTKLILVEASEDTVVSIPEWE